MSHEMYEFVQISKPMIPILHKYGYFFDDFYNMDTRAKCNFLMRLSVEDYWIIESHYQELVDKGLIKGWEI